MIIKKFQAETEDAAILQAKEELGNNAVVVNIKTLKPRGIMGLFKKPTVEVTAALEEKDNVQDKIKPAAVQDNAGKDMIKAMQYVFPFSLNWCYDKTIKREYKNPKTKTT